MRIRILDQVRRLLGGGRGGYRRPPLSNVPAREEPRQGRRGGFMPVTLETIRQIANEDYMIWAIRRTLRQLVVQIPWRIEPDTDSLKAEMQRWQQFEIARRRPGGELVEFEFQSTILPKDLQERVRASLARVPRSIKYSDQVRQVQTVFDAYGKLLDQEANEQADKARELLQQPNNDTEPAWRALMERVVDDLCVFDAAGIALNRNALGELAELYYVPGDEIVLLRYPDGSRPRPPDPAYVWRREGRELERFTAHDLVYLVQNPQDDGYGMSPVEAAIYIILGSLEAERFSLDLLRQFNVPPAILALGGVTEEQVEQVEAKIHQELRARKRHKVAVLGGIPAAEMKLLQLRGLTPNDINMENYLRWSLYAKCMVFGLSPQDIGVVMDFHRTTAETQERLTQIRAVRSLLDLLAQYINAGIVKPEHGLGCDKIRFTWEYEAVVDPLRDAQVDWGDLQRGVITINDRRRKRGMDPIPGGDVPAVQTGMGLIPVDRLEEVQLTSEEEGSAFAPEEAGLEQAGMVLGYQPSELGRVNVPAELGNIFEAMKQQEQGGQEAGGGQGGNTPPAQAVSAAVRAATKAAGTGVLAERIEKLLSALEAGDPEMAARHADKLRKSLLKAARRPKPGPSRASGDEVARDFSEALRRLRDYVHRIVEEEDVGDLLEDLRRDLPQSAEAEEDEDEEADSE